MLRLSRPFVSLTTLGLAAVAASACVTVGPAPSGSVGGVPSSAVSISIPSLIASAVPPSVAPPTRPPGTSVPPASPTASPLPTLPSPNASALPPSPASTSPLPSPSASIPAASPSGSGTQELDVSLAGTFGSTELAAGFSPDPFTASLSSGGPVDASYLGGDCKGFAAVAPDYEVTYASGTATLLRFYFDADEDTTLIINDPAGEWVCNDDAYGFDPSIDFDSPAGGTYDIWVGSFAQGTIHAGTLSVTELSDNHP